MSYFANDLTHDKLLILYFLRTVDMQVTNEQLIRVSAENGWINYFDLQDSLIDLVDNSLLALVHKPSGNYYALTPLGRDLLTQFEQRIPHSVREALTNYAANNRADLQKQTQVFSEIHPLDDGEFRVSLRLVENSLSLAEISLLVDSRDTAKRVCEAWNTRSDDLYGALLKMFLD